MGRFQSMDIGTLGSGHRGAVVPPRIWLRALLWVAMMATVCCVAFPPAPASANGAISDDQVRSILGRINETGRVSRADRSALLTRPDVASQIVDPASGVMREAPGSSTISPEGQSLLTLTTYATRSRSLDRYIQYSSITGATILDYHFTI